MSEQIEVIIPPTDPEFFKNIVKEVERKIFEGFITPSDLLGVPMSVNDQDEQFSRLKEKGLLNEE